MTDETITEQFLKGLLGTATKAELLELLDQMPVTNDERVYLARIVEEYK